MATEIEILRRRVARIEDLLSQVLPTIPQQMASERTTRKFTEDKDRDQKEIPSDRGRI